jgi:sigma-E factor negative regulatory protein RseC
MKREGKVLEVNDGKALVVLMKHAACGDCGACHIGDENMDIKIEALNAAGAHIGDRVEVDLENVNVLGAAFIAYGIPLLAMIVGVLAGQYVLELLKVKGDIEVYSFLIGALSLVVSYLFIKANEGC